MWARSSRRLLPSVGVTLRVTNEKGPSLVTRVTGEWTVCVGACVDHVRVDQNVRRLGAGTWQSYTHATRPTSGRKGARGRPC
jgi:hypothetical protein